MLSSIGFFGAGIGQPKWVKQSTIRIWWIDECGSQDPLWTASGLAYKWSFLIIARPLFSKPQIIIVHPKNTILSEWLMGKTEHTLTTIQLYDRTDDRLVHTLAPLIIIAAAAKNIQNVLLEEYQAERRRRQSGLSTAGPAYNSTSNKSTLNGHNSDHGHLWESIQLIKSNILMKSYGALVKPLSRRDFQKEKEEIIGWAIWSIGWQAHGHITYNETTKIDQPIHQLLIIK